MKNQLFALAPVLAFGTLLASDVRAPMNGRLAGDCRGHARYQEDGGVLRFVLSSAKIRQSVYESMNHFSNSSLT